MISAKLCKDLRYRKYDDVVIKDIAKSDSNFIKNMQMEIFVYYDKYFSNGLALEFIYYNDGGVQKSLTAFSRGRTMKQTISDAVKQIKRKKLMYYI